MDFYDSLFQYDLEIQNKLTERINTFIKSINLLKNESLINQPNNKDSKYKHINILIDEINTSNKFKTKLILNQKKQLLFRMNNKNKSKINSKYYIYAKDMNKDNQKIDIIQIDNTLLKKESNKEENFPTIKKELELEKCFNQKRIYFEKSKEKDKNNISEEENNLNKLKSDINKIVCDIIKQNVKNIYIKKINDISQRNHKKTINKEKNIIQNNDNNTANINIKNNNYIKIDMPKKDVLKESQEGKEIKKIHNNHSTEKNGNLINYFNDNKKKSIKKELRNSVTNNNGNHLKIKVYKNDLLNFNNLNNHNFNNLLIINNKIKSAKNTINSNINIIRNNNIQSKRLLEKENKSKQKEIVNEEKEDLINDNKNINKNINIKKNNNKDNKEKNNNDNNSNDNNSKDNKNGDQNHKKMIIRNIQRIQIKNIKLKNNPTGYNLTNICKKKLEDFDCPEKNNLKKSRQKERNCASPGDIIVSSNKKINILKFKLGKNDPTPVRKHTERSFKKNNEGENIKENDNSIISILDEKTKDIYSQGIRFSSVKKGKNNDNDNMSCNELSQICRSKNINNNIFLIRNYKTNINRNNINNLNDKNSFTRDSEIDNYFAINRNQNLRKSSSKESGSHSYLPWNLEGSNAKLNISNNKDNMIESYLNQVLQIDKKNNLENGLKNINEYKKIKKRHNETHYIYNENILPNNDINKNYIVEQKLEEGQIKDKKMKNKNKSIYTKNKNNNFKENKNLAMAGYNDTINNRDEPISYREGAKIKGKRRILSTRVHIRGVNSSKNFNNIL